MMDMITSGVTDVISMGASVINAIFGAEGTWTVIQPLIAIGIACGVIGFAIRTIKSLAWGF